MAVIRFKNFLNEGKFPVWTKVVVGGIVLKIRNLQSQINTETDANKKLDLIGQQNVLISYISGISVAVNSKDNRFMNKVKSSVIAKRGGK